MVKQWIDTNAGDTFRVQRISSVIAAAGTIVQANDTAPANDQWNFVVVEIRSQ